MIVQIDPQFFECLFPISNGPDGSTPADIAFLAMTQHRLGKLSEARGNLDRLRELMKGDDWANDEDAQGFLREAQALIKDDSIQARGKNDWWRGSFRGNGKIDYDAIGNGIERALREEPAT